MGRVQHISWSQHPSDHLLHLRLSNSDVGLWTARFSVCNSIFELALPLILFTHLFTTMPPKKTTATKKGTQADGQTSLYIVELLPSNPPSPGLSNLGDGSYYKAPSSNLATTLTLLAQSLSALKKSSNWTKVWEPDIFDGSDTCKSQPFLVQCTLNFRNCPDTFSTDSAKVTFALSYLKGTALDWFKLSLASGLNPSWLDDYSNFILELKKNFRPHNPKGEAEADLENLCMHENQCIVKYLVNFNRLTTCVQWGKATLVRATLTSSGD